MPLLPVGSALWAVATVVCVWVGGFGRESPGPPSSRISGSEGWMSMSIRTRHNIHIIGRGDTDIVFAHGFGCDQNMWRCLTPAFEENYRLILYDLVGSGKSDLGAYDRSKYSSLAGHAEDVLEIVREVGRDDVVFVGHSVSSMIGLLAGVMEPGRFSAQVWVGPSPCYINDGDYRGGFERADIEALLDTLDSNYLGWASAMAPKIMGAPEQPELSEELTNSFCRTDPDIARHFAHVTFTSDNRSDLARFETRCLLLQSSDDMIAPMEVGEYLARTLPSSTLRIVRNIGHCPHLSAPDAIIHAMREFLVT